MNDTVSAPPTLDELRGKLAAIPLLDLRNLARPTSGLSWTAAQVGQQLGIVEIGRMTVNPAYVSLVAEVSAERLAAIEADSPITMDAWVKAFNPNVSPYLAQEFQAYCAQWHNATPDTLLLASRWLELWDALNDIPF